MGLFVTIEGGDGSGKNTQATILESFARDTLDLNVLKIAFPQHEKPTAYTIDHYLNGRYGSAKEVPADLISLAYGLDRFSAKEEMLPYINDPKGMVISDRYIASNMAHQGTKFDVKAERIKFYERVMETEFGVLGIPVPDINIVLLVTTSQSQANVDQKSTRAYTEHKRDIHEADQEHLRRARKNYEELTMLYPDKFFAINCMDGDTMRSIEDIQKDIQKLVLRKLKAVKKK